MDSLKRNKRLGWAVLVLIVINLILLSVLWAVYSHRPGRGSRGKAGGIFLEKRLELTPAQTLQLEELRGDHFKRMEDLRKEFQQARKGLYRLWKAEEGAASMEDRAEEIGKSQARMEMEIYRHFADVRALCTDRQKAIFDNIIEEVLRRGEIRGGPHGEGPSHRGRRPGPGGNLPPPDGH